MIRQTRHRTCTFTWTLTWASSRVCAGAIAVATAVAVCGVASAQPNKGPPNALQGFSQNRGQPVQIEAVSLEVRDKDKVAVFNGNVRVVQGDTTMRCKSLVVYYEDKSKPGTPPVTTPMRTAAPGPAGSQSISKLEAKGGVTVTQKDQTATGDSGVFDMRANTITLIGNVTVSQGANIMRGERLTVDLTSGVSRVESGKNKVQLMIQQDSATPGTPDKPGTPGVPRLSPTRPFAPN